MSKEEVWYFSYGSNLNLGQMMNRVGKWTISKKAVLKGYKLVFNVKSTRWGGLTANLRKTDNPNDIIFGALYSVISEKLDVLTVYEGIDPSNVIAEAEGVKVQAKTYVFQTSRESSSPPWLT